MSMVISRYLNCRENRLPTLQSQHLFALTKEVRIEHEGEEYRLRLTRNNRLILTKETDCPSHKQKPFDKGVFYWIK